MGGTDHGRHECHGIRTTQAPVRLVQDQQLRLIDQQPRQTEKCQNRGRGGDEGPVPDDAATLSGNDRAPLNVLGLPVGPARAPVGPMSEPARAQLHAALDQAGLLDQ